MYSTVSRKLGALAALSEWILIDHHPLVFQSQQRLVSQEKVRKIEHKERAVKKNLLVQLLTLLARH